MELAAEYLSGEKGQGECLFLNKAYNLKYVGASG